MTLLLPIGLVEAAASDSTDEDTGNLGISQHIQTPLGLLTFSFKNMFKPFLKELADELANSQHCHKTKVS